MAFLFIPDPTIEAQVAVDPEIGATLFLIGEGAEGFVRDHAPVETGRLRNSIRRESVPGNGQRISVNVDYWNFPEYGTSKMPATPYLRPALSASGLNLA